MSSKARFKPKPKPKPRPRARPKPKAKAKEKAVVKTEPSESGGTQRDVIGSSSGEKKGGSKRKGNGGKDRSKRGRGAVVKPVKVEVTVESEHVEKVKTEAEAAALQATEDGEKKDWSLVDELWQMEDDPLDPLELPFVPEAYRRINSTLFDIFSTKSQGDIDPADAQKVILVQMPRYLPFKKHGKQKEDKVDTGKGKEEKSETEQGEKAGDQDQPQHAKTEESSSATSGLHGVGSGNVGKVQVHKSGRTTLRIGETLFELNPGYNCAFQQELCAYLPSKKTLCSLSKVDGRVVCVPDIQSALKQYASQRIKSEEGTKK